MATMIMLSFVIGYPLFMAFAFILFRFLFPSAERIAVMQQKETNLLMQKARRVRGARRKPVKRRQPEAEPVFVLPDFKLQNQ